MPNAAAGASAPMLQFESPASAGLSNLYLAEAKSADAVLPNAAAGASAPMLQFESPASAGLSNLYPAEAKSADAVLPNAAAGTRISHAAFLCSADVSAFALPERRFITATTAMTTRKITVESAQSAVLIVVCEPLVALTT